MDMINLQCFKCFYDTNFQLGKITVLAGINGSGKTSLLHAFGILHQTVCETNSLDNLVLNGYVTKLGRASDVINRAANKQEIVFNLISGENIATLSYNIDKRDDMTLKCRTKDQIRNDDISVLKNLIYLTADRIGPRELHSLEDSYHYNKSVGVYGERTVNVLLRNESLKVSECLRKPGSPLLIRQVKEHMKEIFDNFNLDLSPISDTNFATLRLANDDAIGFVRPQNTGFGFSYALPIYVACLSAPAGSMIIIENPESHLHPKAQSLLGQFLSKVASAGVQVIIETHSDHLLNGIRKAVKYKFLNAEDTIIHFFAGIDSDGYPKIESPRLAPDGSVSMWPANFCDQFDKDLAELVGWV